MVVLLSTFAGAVLGGATAGVIVAIHIYVTTSPHSSFLGTREDWTLFGLFFGLAFGTMPGAVIGLITSLFGYGLVGGMLTGLAVDLAFLIIFCLHVWDERFKVLMLIYLPAAVSIGLYVAWLSDALNAARR
jgi:hypothetical protein